MVGQKGRNNGVLNLMQSTRGMWFDLAQRFPNSLSLLAPTVLEPQRGDR